MNENARQLIDDLENERLEQFDMSDVVHPECGSPSCIGGHAEYRRRIALGMSIICLHINLNTYEWLGLEFFIGEQLCFPKDMVSVDVWGAITKEPYQATQKQAAQALRRAVELSESQ